MCKLNIQYFDLGGGKTDMLKLILAIFVVAIHTTGFEILFPILRCAVPLFFMLSSYFFFSKYDNTDDIYEQRDVLFKYIKRNLQLYTFWFIVLLPFTLVHRGYLNESFFDVIVKLLYSTLLSSTFPASWYIIASVIGVSLVIYMGKIVSSRISLAICVLVYCVCVLTSNYGEDILNPYCPYNSFPVSLIWIWLGRFIAQNRERIKSLNYYRLILYFAGCLFLLYIEFFIISHFQLAIANDCYFFLIPTCFIFLIIFGKTKINFSPKPFMRKASTIIYCTHIPIAVILSFVLKYFGVEYHVLVFPITVIFSMSLAYIITRVAQQYSIMKLAY